MVEFLGTIPSVEFVNLFLYLFIFSFSFILFYLWFGIMLGFCLFRFVQVWMAPPVLNLHSGDSEAVIIYQGKPENLLLCQSRSRMKCYTIELDWTRVFGAYALINQLSPFQFALVFLFGIFFIIFCFESFSIPTLRAM